MDKVNFTSMENGTAEEYAFLAQLEEQFKIDLPKRLIERLMSLNSTIPDTSVMIGTEKGSHSAISSPCSTS